jgi:hypothetical protein
VRWNGTAESVEYHQPYLVLFATGFTEVRRVDNGDLVHVIHSPGLYIQNSWDTDSLQATLSGISSPTQDEWDMKAWESQLAGHPPGAGCVSRYRDINTSCLYRYLLQDRLSLPHQVQGPSLTSYYQ